MSESSSFLVGVHWLADLQAAADYLFTHEDAEIDGLWATDRVRAMISSGRPSSRSPIARVWMPAVFNHHRDWIVYLGDHRSSRRFKFNLNNDHLYELRRSHGRRYWSWLGYTKHSNRS